MGYYIQKLSTIFKGTTVLGFKQRWNARKIIKNLSKADRIIFAKLPQEIERDHKISQAIKDVGSALRDENYGVEALNRLLLETELQEDNFDKAVKIFLAGVGDTNTNDEKSGKGWMIDIMEKIKKALMEDEQRDREEYKDIESFIIAAKQDRMTLRNKVKLRFKKVTGASFLERLAIRSESKDVTSAIDKLAELAQMLRAIKSTPPSRGKSLRVEKVMREAVNAIEEEVKEITYIKRRSFLWLSKILYDLIVLEELLGQYAVKHLIPLRVAHDSNMRCQTITNEVLNQMNVIAQAFRIQIKAIDDNISELSKIEQRVPKT